jgi:hypothetical protein
VYWPPPKGTVNPTTENPPASAGGATSAVLSWFFIDYQIDV